MSADLQQRLLALLSRREYSRTELVRRFSGDVDADELAALLDTFAERGWQSDLRFAQAWIKSHASRHGRLRLIYDLKSRGIHADLIQTALADYAETEHEDGDSEYQRAHAVWLKKFRAPPQDPKEYARHARFLAARGYSGELIRRVLAGLWKA